MVSKLGAQRIAYLIYDELSTLLILDVSDPRLGSVSITHVRVDTELSYANVYVSSIEGSEAADEILSGLNHAKGYLMRSLTQRIQLRSFPRLRFNWDPIPERADKIDKILDSISDDDASPNPDLEEPRLDG